MSKFFSDFMTWLANPHPKTPPLIEQIKRKYFSKNKEVQQIANVSSEELQQQEKILYGILYFVIVAVVIVFISCAYRFQWDWTGFSETQVITTSTKTDEQTNISKQDHSGKTLWDWLELLIAPILLAILGYQFQQRDKEKAAERQAQLEKQRQQQAQLEKERAERQAQLEREIAKDNLSEEAIQAYLNNMAKLLLNKELKEELFPDNKSSSLDNDNPVKDIARTQITAILRRLEGDHKRQARIIHFLRDTELYEFVLINANLREVDLKEAVLKRVHLEGANLEKAKLYQTNLEEANLEKAHLEGANLEGANLERAKLYQTNLEEANLEKAHLEKSHLKEANLKKANLKKAKLYQASLIQSHLEEAHLEKAGLNGANLSSAHLEKANLEGAHLKGTKLYQAHLEGAHLKGADLERADLNEAKLYRVNLERANLWKACLKKAPLYGAHMKEANLKKADFTGINTKNLAPQQIKSACNWEQATYKPDESENQQYIEYLKKDTASDLKEPPDCSIWEK